MAQIVSGNYRDRQSPYRWLIREEGEPIETARACKSVIAKNFRFVKSSAAEEGFGCRVVARCESAVGSDFEPARILVEFDGSRSFRDGTGKEIPEGHGLFLHEDGRIEIAV